MRGRKVEKSMKLKSKKTIIVMLIVAIIATLLVTTFLNLSKVFATETIVDTKWNRYFYNQLNPNSKGIYDAMFEMFKDGIFKSGGSKDITDKVTSSSMSLAINGNDQLLRDYGAARDAFQNDHPDCFYVDWDELSIRVTQDTSGKLHASLGPGRSDSYLLAGMSEARCEKANEGHGTGIEGAIKQYEEKLQEVVNKIKNNKSLTDGEGEELGKIEGEVNGSFSKDVQETIRMVGEAHDYVVKNMIYRHEEDLVQTDRICPLYASEEHKDEHSTCRTAYDGLIYGVGVCEAYTRTFKAILDRLGIPCVCVTGIYSPKSTINEPHIWNYVQIDGKWYGVDVTHDDPTWDRWWYQKNSKHETREFWLVGEGTLASHHFPQGIISSANFEFTYPTLSHNSLRETYVNTTDDGIKVEFDKDYQYDDQTDEAFESSTVYISYNGKNYTQNAKEGKYIMVKTYMYTPGTDEWSASDWWYIDPWYICYWNQSYWDEIESPNPRHGTKGEDDAEYFTKIEFPQVRKIEVAVTDVPPGYTSSKKEWEEKGYTEKDRFSKEYIDWANRHNELMKQGAAYFSEAEDTLEIRSDVIDNKYGNYVKPPMCKTLSPGGTLYAEDWYTIVMKFDEELKLKDGCQESDIKINMTTSGGAGISVDNAGATAGEYAVLEDIKWNGKDEVSFRFRASQMWADDHTYYTFQVENLVGVGSQKQPMPETIGMTFRRYCSVYKAQGYERNVYGQPQLMDSNTVDLSEWAMKDNLTGDDKEMSFDDYAKEYMDKKADDYGSSETFLNALRERLTLVTAETSPNQKTQMEDAIENQFGEDKIVKGTVNTYNISITTCQMQVVKTGQGVRIALGFPKGTTYEDFAKGGKLSFKAYHYLVDPETDKLNGKVEPIDVTVTRQGLVLLVKSFSPFTVAAVENDNVDTTKTLVTTAGNGGKITLDGKKLEGANANVTFEENQEKEFEIVADEGYEIDSIEVNGINQKITENNKSSVKIKYSTLETGAILNARFVAKEIHQEEAKNGLSHIITIPDINITTEKTSFEYVAGDKIEIKAKVLVSGEDFHPKGSPSANEEHPDYVKYVWYKFTGGRPYVTTEATKLGFEATVEGDNYILTKDSASLGDEGRYYLMITPMTWDDATSSYTTYKNNSYPVSKSTGNLEIKVYNEMEIDLTSEDENKLDGEKIEGYTLALDVHSNYKLNAKVTRKDKNNNAVEVGGTKIIWSSSNNEIISVNTSGQLFVEKYSETPVTITASVKDINGEERTVKVKVTINEIKVQKITITKNKDNIKDGENDTLTVEIEPAEAYDVDVKWSIVKGSEFINIEKEGSNTAIVTGKKVGTATVKATAGGSESTIDIIVVETPVEAIIDDISGDSDTEANVTLSENTTGRVVKVEVSPKTATNKTITWETTNENVAKVQENSDGTYTFVPGKYVDGEDNTCVITAKAGSVTKKYNITLEKNIIPIDSDGVTIIPTEKTIKLGESVDFNFTISPADATVGQDTWSVEGLDGNSTDIISVDGAGLVTGLKVGTAKVKVTVKCLNPTCPEHEASATVTVEPIEATDVVLNKSEMTLIKGNSDNIDVIEILPENTTNKEVTWKVEPEGLATLEVTDNGMKVKVTGNVAGNGTITATCGNATAVCNLTVNKIPVESIDITDGDLTIKDDEKDVKLSVDIYPLEADDKEIEWSVSPDGIISISDDGTITPLKDGEATVTSKVKGTDITDTIKVTVIPSEAQTSVYIVDQKGNFLPEITVRLEKIDDDGNITLVDEITGDGKVDFGKVKDGKYALSIVRVPEEDFAGNRLNFVDIVGEYEFYIEEGKIVYLNSGEIEFVDNIILSNVVDYPNEEEDSLEAKAVTPEYYKTTMKNDPNFDTEKALEEFLATKPKEPETNPGNTNPGNTNPGTTDPGTTDPGTTDPGTTDPGTTDPGTTDPGTTNPGTTDPGTTDPGTTDSETTDPGTTNPGTTNPGSDNQNTDNPPSKTDNDGERDKGNGDDNVKTPSQALAVDDTTVKGPLPKTSDIAIGMFVTIMIVSFIGIIFIVYKKNKK